mmetsp:Transcript_16135/g.41120  ORF Transcript_16135/g.41120 Transcript_16135/m.41120 type:complete len:117 (-) Transcript_16135:6-356(-)
MPTDPPAFGAVVPVHDLREHREFDVSWLLVVVVGDGATARRAVEGRLRVGGRLVWLMTKRHAAGYYGPTGFVWCLPGDESNTLSASVSTLSPTGRQLAKEVGDFGGRRAIKYGQGW